MHHHFTQVHIHDIQVHTVHHDDLAEVLRLDDDFHDDEVEEADDEVDGKNFYITKIPALVLYAGFF